MPSNARLQIENRYVLRGSLLKLFHNLSRETNLIAYVYRIKIWYVLHDVDTNKWISIAHCDAFTELNSRYFECNIVSCSVCSLNKLTESVSARYCLFKKVRLTLYWTYILLRMYDKINRNNCFVYKVQFLSFNKNNNSVHWLIDDS